jgi:hypothetical protein
MLESVQPIRLTHSRRLTHADADKRFSVARFARYYMIRLQHSYRR